MRGSGPATAAHDRGAGGEHPRDHLTEVRGLGRIDQAALDALGEAGVWLQRARHDCGRRTGSDQRLEAGERARAAVDSNGVDTGLCERGRSSGRGCAVRQQEILPEGHLGDQRQIAGTLDLFDRGQQSLQIAEGLAHEQVDAAFEEPFDLLAEGRPREPGMRSILDSKRSTKRADGPGDQSLASGDVSRFAGELRRAAVHLSGQLLQPELGETEAIGAEGVGLDGVGAGLEVLAVDSGDDLGVGQDDLVEAGSLGNAAAVEQRAHCPVEQQRPASQLHAEALAFGQCSGVAGGTAGSRFRAGQGEQFERRPRVRGRHA